MYDITYYVPRKPIKLPGSPQKATKKKIQGRNLEIISLAFWKKFSDQKDILKLTDLYQENNNVSVVSWFFKKFRKDPTPETRKW